MEHPRPLLESMRLFVANPLQITEAHILEARGVSLWLPIAFWCSGLFFCWFGGWARVHYQYSPLSHEVLSGALLCSGVSVVLSLALARTNLKLHWKIASIMFFINSMGIAGFFFIGSHAAHKVN